MMVILLCSMFVSGYHALTITKILMPITEGGMSDLYKNRSNIDYIRNESAHVLDLSFREYFSELYTEEKNKNINFEYIFGRIARDEILFYAMKHDSKKEQYDQIWLTASSKFNASYKLNSDDYKYIISKLTSENRVRLFFNKSLFIDSDSSNAEGSGILGALVGSVFSVIVCLVFAVPLGVLCGVCLHEFMPKNIFTRAIEISINNLSAVPSIIFGILGLILYIGLMGLPRSSSLVGGLTLSLMMVPNVVIATKNAFALVPQTIKDAAFALGASHAEVVVHHSLPIAVPSIVQGILLSLARILGESSPLLMIGMVAFIADVPKSFADPATVLPVQIYMWSSNPDAEFTELAAAAIVALLLITLCINFVVNLIRRKYDKFVF